MVNNLILKILFDFVKTQGMVVTYAISRNVYIIRYALSRFVKSNGTFKQDRGANPEVRGSVSREGTDDQVSEQTKKKHSLM